MKVVIATHHFPPHYIGGVEMVTFRLARWLSRHNVQVEVVCGESISDDESAPIVCNPSRFENFIVNRLTTGIGKGISSFKNSYDHPAVEVWFEDYLAHTQPDLVHVQSCYLLSSSLIPAARSVRLPVVITLHDYWFICPQVKLIRPNGALCDGQKTPAECAWCLLSSQKRRYRWLDRLSLGLAERFHCSFATSRLFASHSSGQLSRMVNERQKLLLRRLRATDMVLTPSSFLREKMIYAGLSPKRIRLVRHGLDLDTWKPAVREKTHGKPIHIGYIGQIEPPKGVHLLIKAFSQLRASKNESRLFIYGGLEQSPSYVQRLKRLAKNDSRIIFAGRYDNSRLPQLLVDLDVVVVPSQWYEIGPLVTLEALANRTPVVATDLPNMNTQITHGVNGLLFEPGNVYDLSRQLQKLSDQPELLNHLKAGIEPVRTFDQEAGETHSIYCEVLEQAN